MSVSSSRLEASPGEADAVVRNALVRNRWPAIRRSPRNCASVRLADHPAETYTGPILLEMTHALQSKSEQPPYLILRLHASYFADTFAASRDDCLPSLRVGDENEFPTR